MKGENKFILHDLAFSSEDEDAPITLPKSFLKCNTETECTADNSSSFLPNSDDELAKYLDSEVIPDINIKKEKPEDTDYSPTKMIKKEKKGPSNRKRRWDGDEKKNRPKKRKSLDEKTCNMEQCLKIVTNLEDLEMKESNMGLLAEHLDKHTHGSTMELMEENIPKIYDTLKVICKFTISFKKMLNHILFKLDEKMGEPIIDLLCGGCHLHCIGNWNLPNPTGRPPKESPPLLMKWTTQKNNWTFHILLSFMWNVSVK